MSTLLKAYAFVTALTLIAADVRFGRADSLDKSGTIKVEFAGPLAVTLRDPRETDSTDQRHEAAGKELTSATVQVGSATIYLDGSRSQTVRDELVWWSVPRHGDTRVVQAEVTGRMVFTPLKVAQRQKVDQKAMSGKTLVPIVMVESIKVQLVGPNGQPRGRQFDRPLVIAEPQSRHRGKTE